MDGEFEMLDGSECPVGEEVALEVAPGALDVVQFGRVFWQPLDSQPGPHGERGAGQLADVDRAVVEHQHDGEDLASGLGSVTEVKLLQQSNEIAGTLARADMHDPFAGPGVEHAERRPLARLTRCRDAQVGTPLGPGMRQIRMGQHLGFIAEQENDVAGFGLLAQQTQRQPRPVDGLGILPPVQAMAGAPPTEPPFMEWPAPLLHDWGGQPEGDMKDVRILGVDLGKNSCSVVGLDAVGQVVLRRRMRRDGVVALAAKLPGCVVAMEACCGAHHLGRLLAARGHEVRLMSPEYVRPYVKAQKNDDRDAEAIAEAASRPTMRFVALKTEAQLDVQVLHRVRDRLVGQRTSLMNQIRSILLERGIVIPQGRRSLLDALATVSEEAGASGIGLRVRLLLEDMLDQGMKPLAARAPARAPRPVRAPWHRSVA